MHGLCFTRAVCARSFSGVCLASVTIGSVKRSCPVLFCLLLSSIKGDHFFGWVDQLLSQSLTIAGIARRYE